MTDHSPTPWTHTTGPGKISAVVDAMGNVVCGSLIVPQTPQSIANHKRIAELEKDLSEARALIGALADGSLVTKIKAYKNRNAKLEAALERVREPTEEMLIAARDWSYKKYGKPIGNEAAIGCWTAMLAAELKEGE